MISDMSQMNPGQVPAPSLDTLVGRKVHMMMWDRRISQTALGRQVGIDQSSLSKRLRGERNWTLDDLRAVATVLGTSIAYLVGETNEGPEGGASGPSLPHLDSNQEPIGFQSSGEIVHVDFARRRNAGAQSA